MAPFTNPVPVIVTFLVVPRAQALGVAEVTVGPVLTVNTPAPVAVPASGLTTVTLRAPVAAAPVIVMFAVSDVPLTKVVELTVSPVPEKVAVAPFTNPVPVIVMVWPAAP